MPMPVVDPSRMVATIDAAIASAAKPEHVTILENFKRHYTAELVCDMDGVLETMVDDPLYREWGTGNPTPHENNVTVKGPDENRAYYQGAFDLGASIFEIDHDRFAVTDWGVVGDGDIRIILPGPMVKAFAPHHEGAIDDTAHYLVSYRIAYFFPYRDGKCVGEDLYHDRTTAVVRKLDPGEVVTADQIRASL